MVKKDKMFWIILFLLPGAILFCVFLLVPMFTVLVTGFTKWDGLGNDITFIGFQNYVNIFTTDRSFRAALVNVIKWSGLGVFVHVPLAVILSLVLARKPFGWRFVRSVYMIPIIISQAALATVFRYLFNAEYGLVNGVIRLFTKGFSFNWLGDPTGAFWVVSLTWLIYAAIPMLIIMAELISVSGELFESAAIDGATSLQVDWYIKLPLIRKSIGTAAFLTVTGVFKQFDNVYLTTQGGPGDTTTNITILVFNNIRNLYRSGYANALGTILIILGVIVMAINSKLFAMNQNLFE